MVAGALKKKLAMQTRLRAWGEANRAAGLPDAETLDGRLLDQFDIDWFHEMNRALHDRLDNAAFAQRTVDNVERMAWLAAEILQRARDAHSRIDDCGLDGLLADTAVQPSLAAEWYAAA